ncbi:MAG: hypothetical protein KTR14_06595 [Vampirovibrio sp.]|nr:hypothetical protein [Vampirovibrio sp.]
MMDEQTFKRGVADILTSSEDGYVRMNRLRDWFNETVPRYEIYLEDVWNEAVDGETHIEYILRSLGTLNETSPLGYDVYNNHRDDRGVWHLDDYVKTVQHIQSSQIITDFIHENDRLTDSVTFSS